MVGNEVREICKRSRCPVWSRVPGAAIVFPETFEMKSKLLDAYGIPAPENWNKYMHQGETYESSLS
jgi:hypothetical protein